MKIQYRNQMLSTKNSSATTKDNIEDHKSLYLWFKPLHNAIPHRLQMQVYQCKQCLDKSCHQYTFLNGELSFNLYVKRSQKIICMVSIHHSGLDLTCVCVYESAVRDHPPPDLITVALHKPLCHKEVKDTDIYYPQSISHFLYSGVVKHTIKCAFFCL